jgi:hypothetical protein
MSELPAFNMRYIWLTTLVSAMGGLLFHGHGDPHRSRPELLLIGDISN